jgi:hypothetical protein
MFNGWEAHDKVEVSATWQAQLFTEHPAGRGSMHLYESGTHSFIVKIWREESAAEAGRATWRGHITHVPSGDRRYLSSLDEICRFIAPYLEQLGIRMGVYDRFTRWLNRWKRS